MKRNDFSEQVGENNPWTTVSSRVVYENRWMTVREDGVVQPDGSRGIYAYIEKCEAAGVVALTEENEVVLVGQYRYPLDRYSWEIVEGGVEEGETPLQAAQRELREEAGLIAEDWVTLWEDVQVSNCISAELGSLFLARGLTSCERDPDATEVLKIWKVPFEQCLQMALQGEIKDMFSIMALMGAQRFLTEE